ncbi:hypothetical protein APY03_7857 [Variovorax sp. WDL1]|nr:hypothetical protein APY03_7857 [Variovorax sp. WDL1]
MTLIASISYLLPLPPVRSVRGPAPRAAPIGNGHGGIAGRQGQRHGRTGRRAQRDG